MIDTGKSLTSSVDLFYVSSASYIDLKSRSFMTVLHSCLNSVPFIIPQSILYRKLH